MMRWILIAIVIFAAACAPRTGAPPTPAGVAFPTMTAGRVIIAPLPTPLPGALNPGIANPATAVALANQPTSTPDYTACPPADPALTLADAPPQTAADLERAVTEFLSLGGAPARLDEHLRTVWGDALGEAGFARGDLDLTGEGRADVIVGYRTPDLGSAMLIFVCSAERFVPRYQAIHQGGVAQIVSNADMTYNGRSDLFYVNRECANPDDEESCRYVSNLITWSPDRGRFVSLLDREVVTDSIPGIEDFDQDRVLEIIIRLENPGNAQTGPLRTGFTVFDWNGVVYTPSITQLDPPRFRVQVIHQADAAFRQGNLLEAESLFRLAVNDTRLQNWQNTDETNLRAYALYRLLLIYADWDDNRLQEVVSTLATAYPELPAAPVYATLADAFWNAYQSTANLNSACLAVLDIIAARPEAVTLLNRYGSTSPVYEAQDLCPF